MITGIIIGIVIGVLATLTIINLLNEQARGGLIMDIVPRMPRSQRAHPQPNFLDDGDEYVAQKLMENAEPKHIVVKGSGRLRRIKVKVLKPLSKS